jgi:hypothetical protein
VGSPYRDHRLESLGKEDDGLMPVSPVFGPDSICPKCGAPKDNGEPSWRDKYRLYVTEAKFCYNHKRVFIRWWPWPKRCKHPGEHMHQKCKKCKAHWVSWPLCQKPKDRE